MNILFLATHFPYPPLKGDKVRAYHQLRLLSKRHKFTLLCFADKPIPSEDWDQIAPYCKRIIIVPLSYFRKAINLTKSISSHYPLQTLLYHSPTMKQQLQTLLHQEQFDVVHVQLARMAPYMESVSHIPRVIDLVDALSLNMGRRFLRERGLLKLITYLEWQRLRSYERAICQTYDQVIVVSEQDRSIIGDIPNLHVNPIAVDLDRLPFSTNNRHPKMLVFSGNMGYFPNINAVHWFVQEVLPRVKLSMPDIKFFIVGTNPHREIQDLAKKDSSITVTGYVEDIFSYLGKATVVVVPMRAGSGMQFKVLEAMACRKPVVATPYALGGIDAEDGKHLLVAHDAHSFADKVIQLLSDVKLQKHLARQARQLVEEKYSWEQSVSQLEEIYDLAIQQRQN